MTTEPVLLRHIDRGVCTLTLNRPAQYNALSRELLDAVIAELDAAACLLYTSPSPRDATLTRMPSSA